MASSGGLSGSGSTKVVLELLTLHARLAALSPAGTCRAYRSTNVQARDCSIAQLYGRPFVCNVKCEINIGCFQLDREFKFQPSSRLLNRFSTG